MRRLFETYVRWLHTIYATFDVGALGIFRIFYAFIMLFVGLIPYERISSFAPQLYDPKASLAVFFDLPAPWFFLFLDYLIPILLVLLLFGFKTRWSSLLLGLAFIVGNSFLYSFGKINHGNLLSSVLPLIMAFSNWGDAYSIDSRAGKEIRNESWAICLLSLVIGFGMFTAGIQKLGGGWLDINFLAIKYHIFNNYLNGRGGVLMEHVIQIDSVFFWEFMDWLIVLFELGLLVAVINRRLYAVWISFGMLFHLGVFLILEITFYKNFIPYLLFINWTLFISVMGIRRAIDKIKHWLRIEVMLVMVLLICVLKIVFGSPYVSNIFDLGGTVHNVVLSFFGVATLVVSLFAYFKELRSEKVKKSTT